MAALIVYTAIDAVSKIWRFTRWLIKGSPETEELKLLKKQRQQIDVLQYQITYITKQMRELRKEQGFQDTINTNLNDLNESIEFL